MLELSEDLSIRTFRLQARYTATRLKHLPETRVLGQDFEEAYDKFALLEEEGAGIDVQKVDAQAQVELSDDAWDDTIIAFQRRLLDVVGHDVDAALYRRYFADIPSHVTSLSYAAELLISKELEAKLAVESHPELKMYAAKLGEKRKALEDALHQRTELEVQEARFQNRVAMAKAIVNKLRRVLFASLEEVARTRGLSRSWCLRFYQDHDEPVATMEMERPYDIVQEPPALPETVVEAIPSPEI